MARVYYNGGGAFSYAENFPSTSVLARYADNTPAIIEVHFGAGVVILSGVHIEYNPDIMDSGSPFLEPIIQDLKKNSQTRKIMMEQIGHRLKV